VSGLMALATSAGCCGPLGCETGCGPYDDCGVGVGARGQRIGGPLQALGLARRNFIGGSGCGEVYYGEWSSTPPDCDDPCCDDQFTGGAAPGRPFCWQPGALISALYGVRFCDNCGESVDSCGCGGDTIVDRAYAAGTITHAADCGCGNHGAPTTTRVLKEPTRQPTKQPTRQPVMQGSSSRNYSGARTNSRR
jgi:hypothetical protein